MDQRMFKSPCGSQASTQFKSTTPHSEENSDPASQRLLVESPVPQKVLECYPETSKTNIVKKPLSTKLALLLDTHTTKDKKSKPLSSTTKHFLNTASISPLKENHKTIASESLKLPFQPKKNLTLSSKEPQLKNNQQRQKKPFIKNSLIDLETPTKSAENPLKSRPRIDSSDGKAQNNETKRIRKLRSKNYKFSIDQGNPKFVYQSCNFSLSPEPENSIFIKSLALGKASIEGTPVANAMTSSQTPKQTFITTSLQNLDYYPVAVAKGRPKFKKNYSISGETLVMPFSETKKPAYLAHNSSHNKQFHRKVGSTSACISNVFAKSFTKLDSCYSLNTQVSPLALGLKIPQSLDTISSRNNTTRDSKRTTKAFKTKSPASKKKKAPEVSLDQLNNLRKTFDSLINNAQDNQDVLKNIKQEYEGCIEKLMKSNKQLRDQKKSASINRVVSEENRHNKKESDNFRLIQENIKLQQELTDIRTDRQRLQDLVKTLRIRNHTSSPNQSVLPTEKRGPAMKFESPPPTKHGKKLEQDMDKLKQTVEKQQKTITILRKKEEKMIRLIYALKKQGIDVENIYNQDVKERFEANTHTTQEETVCSNSKVSKIVSETFEQQAGAYQDPALKGKVVSEVTKLDDDSELDCSEMEYDDEKKPGSIAVIEVLGTPSHNKLNPMLKNKLKLDFSALKDGRQTLVSSNQNQNQGVSVDPVGFHEEFMSKFEEFSLSWRQESMLQKNI